MEKPPPPPRGRGATDNIANRYAAHERVDFDDGWAGDGEAPPPLQTRVEIDRSRSILSRNDSPDIPFALSLNPYRGCEHGCVYCYARPSHAWLGYSPGLDFESRLLAKLDAPALLKAELARPGYRCQWLALGSNTDPYQPVERDWRITRGVLEVLAECRHPVAVVTKSSLVERDMDLLADLARDGLARVLVSLTSLDRELSRRMEPRAAAPQRRLETLRRLTAAGIPCGVLVAPVIPALNDAELESLLAAAREAGADGAGYVLLRLPLEVAPLFRDWLAAHYPLKAAHVMSLVNQSRGGRDNDPAFGARMRGSGVFADLIRARFAAARRRLGYGDERYDPDTSRFRPPRLDGQMDLFGP